MEVEEPTTAHAVAITHTCSSMAASSPTFRPVKCCATLLTDGALERRDSVLLCYPDEPVRSCLTLSRVKLESNESLIRLHV